MAQKKEDSSSRKIYYLFGFLFAWYGLAWFFYPKILQRIEGLNRGSQILFFENLSIIFLGIFMTLAILLLFLGYHLGNKEGVDEKI